MNWLRSIFGRRRASDEFGAYVSPELVDEMIRSGKNPSLGLSEARNVEFIWLWLQDADGRGSARIERAVAVGGEFNALVETIFPPVVTFWFGAFPQFGTKDVSRTQCVVALKAEFGPNAKLIHGSASASLGNVGSKTSFRFCIMADWRSTLLRELCNLELGQYSEYVKAANQSSVPTPASVTPPAGQESRPR
jgi:hypothetical protein